MAKGQNSKTDAIQKILNLFPGSFIYDKEVRIPYCEDGEDIQLKCTLTCAKVNVTEGGEEMMPGEAEIAVPAQQNDNSSAIVEPTEEEKQNVKNLMEMFGI